MIFSDEEASYLRAVLKWQEKPPEDKRASWMLGLRMPEKKKPVGEFRILVIGAKGVGKTSILTKVRERSEAYCQEFSAHNIVHGSSAQVLSQTLRALPRQATSTAAGATSLSNQTRASTSSQTCTPLTLSSYLWSTYRRQIILHRPSRLQKQPFWSTMSPTRLHSRTSSPWQVLFTLQFTQARPRPSQ